MWRLGWARLVIALVLTVGILQLVHVILLSRLETHGISHVKRLRNHSPATLEHVYSELQHMVEAIGRSSLLDASGQYKIVNFLARPLSLLGKSNWEDVTLVTHCSSEHLLQVIPLLESWQGPASIAIFMSSALTAQALFRIAYLRVCYVYIGDVASFHLVYPLSDHDQVLMNGQQIGLAVPVQHHNHSTVICGTNPDGLQQEVRNYQLGGITYPNNLLRNVGRRNVHSEFVLVVDVDMVPSQELRSQFVHFARQRRLFHPSDDHLDDKAVYVIPAFEVKDGSPIPKNKAHLLAMMDQTLVRPFYAELCWKCQKHTDYVAWQRDTTEMDTNVRLPLDVMFEVLWKDPWEPFYISRNNVPMYDERFYQYGFNRISQVCELHMAGFRFSVLNSAFLVHKGWKTPTSFHASKDVEQERNRAHFRQFKNELKDKYPDSSRRCY